MPRYFFHVVDDMITRDGEGQECADVAEAWAYALRSARSLICEQVRRGRISLRHRIDVSDEAGNPAFSLSFGDAVAIEGQSDFKSGGIT
ncbi:MAG: DUF6894 family protein [Sphingomonadales bacterium]